MFSLRSPFVQNETELKSLASGLIDNNDKVSCDKTEEIGHKLQLELNNVSFHAAKLKRNNKIKPLESLHNSVSIGPNKVITKKPTILFTRLRAITQRENDVLPYFEYKMTTVPMALFYEGMMRKPSKPAFRYVFQKEPKETNVSSMDVVDGGALLHRVRWPKECSFQMLCQTYV